MVAQRLGWLVMVWAWLAGAELRASSDVLSLGGQWRFQLDRFDLGLGEAWHRRALESQVRLPGDLAEQGIGDPITDKTSWLGGIVDKSWFTAPEYASYRQPGDVKVPFWLQPERRYQGAAWFQRDVKVPAAWRGRRLSLFLERPHWETRVWIGGKALGNRTTLGTPHQYDVGVLEPGSHVLTIRVDNRMVLDVGENSHSISDHTQGNWNGIVGRVELRAEPDLRIEDVQVVPKVAARSVQVHGRVAGGEPVFGRVEFTVKRLGHGGVVTSGSAVVGSDGRFEGELALGSDARLWDEFDPVRYELTAVCRMPKGGESTVRVRFGLREVGVDGTQVTLNGRRLFLRGTLECAIFPRTGHPPTDVASWRKVMEAVKAHGLNLVRFHSWCPPEAAFEAADELGVYLQVECSSWANQSVTLGDGKPVDSWLYAEADRILEVYGNHPSFVFFLYGNEPGGAGHQRYLARWVEHYRARDARRLISGGAGWPQLPQNQFHLTPDPRIQGWGAGLSSRINGQPPETMTDYRSYIGGRTVPVISHEIGQWCVYPRFEEMKKYTGYLKPRNFEIFRDRLTANGMSGLSRAFVQASGRLQVLCYKEEIESALRTPGMAGFELLDLHDFPGQGTALVGVLDPFWEGKGYITATEYRRFCGPIVPLVRLPKRVFTTSEQLTGSVEIAAFGPTVERGTRTEWTLRDQRGVHHAGGSFAWERVESGRLQHVGDLAVPLKGLPVPGRFRLEVRVPGTTAVNDWDVWVYPESLPAEANPSVRVASRLDDALESWVQGGGSLLLTIPAGQVRNYDRDPVKLGFSSIFWNTAWTGRQAPTTLGLLCDPRHPALAQFPTEDHSDWQWWFLVHRAGALRLDGLPVGTQPLVRVIDDWVTARPLGLVVEGKLGAGRVVVCGFDLVSGAEDPVSRQMRSSLVRYLASTACRPRTTFTVDQVHGLMRP